MTRLFRAIISSTFVLGLAACASGCGESAGPPDLTPFVGTWSAAVGGLTIDCSDGNNQALTISPSTTLVMGTESDLLDDDATCPVRYDVSGRIATAQLGQTCSNPDVITRMHIEKDTFTVDGAGMAMHEASGKLDGFINISLGESVKCTFTEIGIYRRPVN